MPVKHNKPVHLSRKADCLNAFSVGIFKQLVQRGHRLLIPVGGILLAVIGRGIAYRIISADRLFYSVFT